MKNKILHSLYASLLGWAAGIISTLVIMPIFLFITGEKFELMRMIEFIPFGIVMYGPFIIVAWLFLVLPIFIWFDNRILVLNPRIVGCIGGFVGMAVFFIAMGPPKSFDVWILMPIVIAVIIGAVTGNSAALIYARSRKVK